MIVPFLSPPEATGGEDRASDTGRAALLERQRRLQHEMNGAGLGVHRRLH